ncbi:CRACD-like protein isoform X2 [Acanthochromis polyacanthus]|uniref:CRACD-like protein isoform X2 n=1 Tax=Acanthochromis polyacanthus TaxID=80966 RepID=UPI002233E3BD|nr:CRACD-like protein isoform X2 [Acanthochromis polyacanthus]
MESFSGDTEESTEDVPGRKKSKLRSLRTRLFRKSKKAGVEENTKLSQSTSDITAAKGLGSDEDLVCSQAMMGSRALSHDSIFLAGEVLTDDEPTRGSSQQNVHSKIKALQTKLLQQKLHFGPPPAVLPVKRQEDPSIHSEESLDHSPPDSPGGDATSYGALTKTTSQPASCPFSPIPRSVPTKSLPPTPSHFFPSYGPTTSASAAEAPLDFSTPAQFSPCLDTSAARHRMSIKPRNQRATSKKKLTVTQSLSLSHALNNVDNFKSVEEPEQQHGVPEEEQTVLPQHLPFKSAEIAPVLSQVAPVPSQVAPVPSKVAPVPSKVAPVPSQVAPVFSEVAPVPSQVAPVPSKMAPVPSQVAPVLSQVAPVPSQVAPVPSKVAPVPSKVPPVPSQVAPVFSEVAPVPSKVAPVPSQVAPVPSQVAPVPSKVAPVPSQVAPVISEAAPKPPSPSLPQQDHALPWTTASALRVKPYRRVDATSSRRPHSSYIESELMERREADFEIQLMSHDKRSALNKAGVVEVPPEPPSSNFSLVAAFRSTSLRQHVQVEGDSTRAIRRPAPGSGSFHLSITTARNRDGERPRSGSCAEVLDQTEAKNKPIGGNEDKENRGLQPRGDPFGVGRLRQEDPKGPVLPWDKRESLKKVELATQSKSGPTNAGVVEAEEVESSQEEVEEAVEAKEIQEEDGKMAFGIKLRSTSQSFRLRPNSTSTHDPKTVLCEDPRNKQNQQEIRGPAIYTSEKLPSNTSFTPTNLGESRPRDPTPSGLSPPVKHSAPFTTDPPIMPAEVPVTTSDPREAETAPQEPQPAPQTATSEVSWMSLAMEKTRSLQQLFTSRFPRDFTGMQTASRPQAQAPPANPTETSAQIQTVKIQEGSTQLEAANQPSAEAALSRSQAQTVRSPPVEAQQKVTPVAFKEPQKQTNQEHPNTSQSHPVFYPQATSWTTPSPVHVPLQTEPTPQFTSQPSLAQSYLSSGQQQLSWSSRGPATQLRSTAETLTPAVTSPAAPPSVDSLGTGEEDPTGKNEAPSLSVRRAVWSGSISDRAVFLEKRAEWTPSPGPKGVELRKPQTDVQTSGEATTLVKATSLSKDAVAEGRQGVKLAESSPAKVLERPLEEKWPRKNVVASSLRSSPPTLPSGLQSMSDSSQPSWMELAKRKSMAWSDKTMD